ncbi:hypothetical protein NQZ68_016713 [Dissostichus eleginoides]|nr:hypothetical protein NQZ68_016713 [Dissostichus eleginoides]
MEGWGLGEVKGQRKKGVSNTSTGHFDSSLTRVGGIPAPNPHRIHHAPPYIKHFFADWLHNQIPSEWAGVGWV